MACAASSSITPFYHSMQRGTAVPLEPRDCRVPQNHRNPPSMSPLWRPKTLSAHARICPHTCTTLAQQARITTQQGKSGSWGRSSTRPLSWYRSANSAAHSLTSHRARRRARSGCATGHAPCGRLPRPGMSCTAAESRGSHGCGGWRSAHPGHTWQPGASAHGKQMAETQCVSQGQVERVKARSSG